MFNRFYQIFLERNVESVEKRKMERKEREREGGERRACWMDFFPQLVSSEKGGRRRARRRNRSCVSPRRRRINGFRNGSRRDWKLSGFGRPR